MSGGSSCKCSEIHEPTCRGDGRPARLWRVTKRRYNTSSFHGGYQSSDYSTVTCLRCGAVWRTKAAYVERLMSLLPDEIAISCGIKGHRMSMLRLGRTEHPNNAESS